MSNSAYPTAIDTFVDPQPTDLVTVVNHAGQHSVANDALAALETKVGVTSSAVTSSLDYKLSGVGAGDKAASLTGTENLTNKTLINPTISGSSTGWVSFGSVTLTYASANSFTTSSDLSAILSKGDRVQLTNNTVKYFVISGVSGTTVTIQGGTDYTLANTAISSASYSKNSTPSGFPTGFAFTPTWTAAGGNPTLGNGTITGRMVFTGSSCTISFTLLMGSTTSFGTGAYSIGLGGVTVGGASSDNFIGTTRIFDNSATTNYIASSRTFQGGTAMVFYGNSDTTGVGPASPMTFAVNDSMTASNSFPL